MLLSLFILPPILGTHGWVVPQDNWLAFDAGRYVWNGALGFVYQGTGSYATPLSFILVAPVAGFCDRWGLVEGSPIPLAHPSAWLLLGPFTLLFGIFLLQAVRQLAWDVGLRRGLWRVQALTVLIVLVPAALWGHFEDVIALTMVVHVARRLMAGETMRAAVYLSVAIASKQWAVVLIPLVVLQVAPGRRLRALFLAAALPVGLVLFVLGVDWADASKALFSPVNLVQHTLGHPAFFQSWLGSGTSRVSRTLGLVLASVLAWRFRGVRRPEQILAAIATVLLIRPFFEAINYSYYWSPSLLLVGLVGVAAHGRWRWRDWIWPLGAMVWATPRAPDPTWWWVGELILLGATALQTAGTCGFTLRTRSRRGLLTALCGSERAASTAVDPA
jgi:hypothetical protein